MTHPPGPESAYQRLPLSAEEKARGEANFAPLVAGALAARGRFRVSADTPDQVELFQGGRPPGERDVPAAGGQLRQRPGDHDHVRPERGPRPD